SRFQRDTATQQRLLLIHLCIFAKVQGPSGRPQRMKTMRGLRNLLLHDEGFISGTSYFRRSSACARQRRQRETDA
ncbi:MAG: hypothetical protein ACE15E_03725, partial [Acidobacteriota bacterium]